MHDHYVLDGKTPVPSDDIEACAELLDSYERRCVGLDAVGVYSVSTAFLVIDRRYEDSQPPRLFETLVRDSEWNEVMQAYYSTWKEAEVGHRAIVELLRLALDNPESPICQLINLRIQHIPADQESGR